MALFVVVRVPTSSRESALTWVELDHVILLPHSSSISRLHHDRVDQTLRIIIVVTAGQTAQLNCNTHSTIIVQNTTVASDVTVTNDGSSSSCIY